jgi:flagellar basal body-associated protein FliL
MSENKEEAKSAAPAAPAAGGIKPMLPLIISVVLMPVLAYVMTAFVLVPQLKSAAGAAPAGAHVEDPAGEGGHGPSAEKAPAGHGAAPAGHGETAGAPTPKGAPKFAIQRMMVNLAGTSGARILMTSLTLVGEKSNFSSFMEENKDKILDVANGTLGSKTIPDLEKPGARNQLRSELLTVINGALGGDVVKEIYITEMAIQ